jgi:hypothetical protein
MSGRPNNFAPEYVDVAARLVEFRTKHPEGSLQPADLTVPFRVERIGDETYIVVVAAAYRAADDPRPGIGMAYEAYPGKTPYTRGSELQNAETSAWGRAIMAALAADSRRGIASAEEVRNRQAERDSHDAMEMLRAQIWAAGNGHGLQTWTDIAADFASWSQGSVMGEAERGELERYRDYLTAKAAA